MTAALKPTIYLIGAGALGRYHLRGLLTSPLPFAITVVDPLPASLAEAHKAVAESPGSGHTVAFASEVTPIDTVDLAIIVTTATHRAAALATLFERAAHVRYVILEKILFDRPEQYAEAASLVATHGTPVWVNHPRRLYPFHRSLKEYIHGPYGAHVRAGARYGLMTTVLHYADYFSFLSGSNVLATDTSLLSSEIVPSKRQGYLELFGTLSFTFENGSWAAMTALPQEGPLHISLAADGIRTEIRESEGEAFLSRREAGWKWQKVTAPLLRQSEMTGIIARRILERGECELPTYAEAARTHRAVLEPVRVFLEEVSGKTFETYPFT